MQAQYIIGRNSILEAFEDAINFEKIYISKQAHGDSIKKIIQKAKEKDVYIQYVPEIKLDYLANKQPHQGAVAAIQLVAYYNFQDIIDFCYHEGRTPLFIILDGITDVRNFGAIARTALGLDADLIIIPKKESVSITADAVKTSAGALLKIPVSKVDNLQTAIKDLKNNGIKIIGLDGTTEQFFHEANLKMPLALVLGAEDTGISAPVLKLLDEKLKLPMNTALESYNVSVANALALYEILRQRS